MVFIIIGISILLLLTGILFLPLAVIADSDRKVYAFSIPVIFNISITGMSDEWKFRLKIFGIPLNLSRSGKRLMKNKDSKPRSKKHRFRFGLTKVITMMNKTIRSFRIRYLQAEIDTGDFPLNAQLIPVISQINGGNITIGINFEDRNSVNLKIITRLYKLIWIIIRYIIF